MVLAWPMQRGVPARVSLPIDLARPAVLLPVTGRITSCRLPVADPAKNGAEREPDAEGVAWPQGDNNKGQAAVYISIFGLGPQELRSVGHIITRSCL